MSTLLAARVFRRLLCILVLSLFVTISLCAQYQFLENGSPVNRGTDAGFLVDTPTRLKLDLSGEWKFQIEDGPSGSVKVPSAYDFTGKVRFTRNIEITSDQIDRYDFHFVMLGSNYNTEVEINGEFITNHAGGYTSFIVPIPGNVLQVGTENVIKVITDNRLNARKTLPLRSMAWGWRNYGGILRDVFILGTPKLCINGVVATTDQAEDNSSARVHVTASMEGKIHPQAEVDSKEQIGFYVEMFEKISGSSVGRTTTVQFTKKGDDWDKVTSDMVVQAPKLWSPESPDLYLLKCFLVSQGAGKDVTVLDEYDLNFGIRDVAVKNGDIFLNGKKLMLKGVVWQEEHPTWGSAMTYEELEKDVALIKSLGANAIRFGGHPPHPYMLNLCDRYGLFGMEELPIANVPTNVLLQDDYVDLASTMAKEMVTRDRTHPSVLAWGVGDQFESSNPASRLFVQAVVGIVRQLDARPTYFASRMLDTDVCADLVDFACYNVSVSDIKPFKSQLQEWKEKHPGKPVIVSRFGTEVQHGNRNGYSDPLSYEAQARFYIQRFDIIKSLEYDGAFVWSFNDWKGDVPALTVSSGDPWLHTMGLVSGQREKRLAYEAVRALFRSEKFVALPIGNYSASAPIIYVLAGLVVLIGAAYFYNASRRFRENLTRAMLNAYNFFADVRDQRVVSIVHSTILGIIVSLATAIVASSILYHFRHSWVLDNLLSFALIYDNVKESMVYLIWNPLKCITYFSILFFLLLLVIAGVVLALSPLFKSRIYPYHAYAIATWSTPPLLILVPVGMILFRVMESSMYVLPALLIIAALMAWVFLRLLKGMSIIYDVRTAKAYVLGVLSLVGILAVAYFYYDYTQSTSTYLAFMYNVMTNSR